MGTDLVQLLAGRLDSGELAAGEIEDLIGVVLGPFSRGLAIEGMKILPRDLGLAVDVSLVIRCAFTALPLERLASLATMPNAERFVRERAAWCRFLVDRGKHLLAA